MSHDNMGERIKLLRGDASLANFAAKFNIHKSTLTRYEKGENQPDASFMRQLCAEFELSPTWLLLGDGPMRHVEDEKNDQPAFFRGYPGKSKNEPSGYEGESGPSQMGLGQAVELLAKIFASNNHILMRAIIANLQAFGEAIDNKEKEKLARAEIEQLRDRTTALESQVGELLAELKGRKEKKTTRREGLRSKASNG